jgi:prolyl-tRNA synthetase
LEKANSLCSELKAQGIRAELDSRDFLSPGSKFYEWERKGVPIRLEVGPRDLENNQVVLAQRVVPGDSQKKEVLQQSEALRTMSKRLDDFQECLLKKAVIRREENTYRGIENIDELNEIMSGSGGYVYTGWSGDPTVEQTVKERTGATLRCIPEKEFRSSECPVRCIGGEKKSEMEVVWAKAY